LTASLYKSGGKDVDKNGVGRGGRMDVTRKGSQEDFKGIGRVIEWLVFLSKTQRISRFAIQEMECRCVGKYSLA
jgi:hypothetical protein